MWYKVAWLFLWMTLAFWAGCAGENQNYEINKQSTPIFQEPPSGGPAGPGAGASSLNGADRSHWEAITVAPAGDGVPHHPDYFGAQSLTGEWLLGSARPSPLRMDGDSEIQATLATAGARYPFTCEDPANLFIAGTKAGIDMALSPAAVVVTPPCKIVHTPEP
ncbi:MAG: hypothetical protein GC162_12400 [Planctomycetes bacterium]|nr:hypothetical protein [Planctomycetota bacterium]